MKLHELSLKEQLTGLKEGSFSSTELTQNYLDRISNFDKDLNSFITVTEDSALNQAKESDNRYKSNKALPLDGVPIAHKDIFCTEDILTTCGSKMLSNFKAPYSSTVVSNLSSDGVVVLGKTNMDEFAMGSSNETSFFGPVKNPWNKEYVPGGSSGGSAACVSAQLASAATATDTGGSIRQPAALCGLTGIKPTYGRVSRYGVFGASWSMDTVGPLSRYVKDSALVLSIIAGYDANDPYSSKEPVPKYASLLNTDISKLKIGLIKQRMDPSWGESDVFDRFNVAVNDLKNLGAEVIEVSLPNIDYSAVASATLINIDASYLNRSLIETSLSGFDYNNQIRLLSGAMLPAVVHKKINAIREIVRKEILDALQEVDVLVLPTSPIIAPKIPVKKGMDNTQEMVDSFGGRRQFTSPFNLANVPAMSVCCGFSDGGMPVGMQIVSKPFDEQTIFNVAYAYESATDWHKMRPNLDSL